MEVEQPRDVVTMGSDRRSRRGTVLAVGVLVAVVALAGYRLVSSSPGETPAAEGAVPTPAAQVPSGGPPGERAAVVDPSRLVYAVGRTVHAGDREVTVRVPRGSTVRVRAVVASGWLVDVGDRVGTVDSEGRFRPWRGVSLPGTGPAMTSPDGSQVLAGVGRRTHVVDLASGRVGPRVPRGRPAAWGDAGVFLFRGDGTTARIWDPRRGFADLRFDARACPGNATAASAAVSAGWLRCRNPGLVAVSPDGTGLVAVQTRQGLRTLSLDGRQLDPSERSAMRSAVRVDGAAFLDDEESVVLSVTSRGSRGLLGAFYGCSLSTGECTRIGPARPAVKAPGAAFVLAPPCESGGGRRPTA